MWRVLFLVLVVTSSTMFAQVEEKSLSTEMPKASVLSEFGKSPNGQIRMLVDNFFLELQNNPTAQGYIFDYGMRKEVAEREKNFRNHIVFRSQDASRITFVRGKVEKEIRTQLWIVPEGAEPPKP